MVGTFLNLQGKIGHTGTPARVNDFETSFLILFVLGLCLRQFFSRSNTTGILAISTTLFGLKPEDIAVTVAAYRRGIGEMDLRKVRIIKA